MAAGRGPRRQQRNGSGAAGIDWDWDAGVICRLVAGGFSFAECERLSFSQLTRFSIESQLERVQEWIVQLRIAGNAFSKDDQAAKVFPRQLNEIRERLIVLGTRRGRRPEVDRQQAGIKLGELARAMGGIKTVQMPRDEWEKKYGNQ